MPRTTLAVTLLLLVSAASGADLPLKMNFQGKLIDPVTKAPKDGAFDMTLRVYAASSGGTALYTETQTNVPVSNGVFSVQIGAVTPLSPDLFAGAGAYLGVQVGTDSEMSPRQQLVMAPYAFTAAQLVGEGSARVRVGTAYSTFTSAGNLILEAGLAASSGTFTGGVTASSGTFTATGGTQYSLKTSSGVLISGGTLEVDGEGGAQIANGVQTTTGTFTATGNSVFSVVATSGVSVGGTLAVAGSIGAGIYFRNVNQNNANCRAACTTAGTRIVGGGCSQASTLQLRRSFPSTETNDAAAIGTAVADGDTAAFSWTCVFSGANAGNRCFAICARIEN